MSTRYRKYLKPINPKRIQLVRDLRMMDEADWPDDMRGEKLGHFCILTGFLMEFFRGDDPEDFSNAFICSNIGEPADLEEIVTSHEQTTGVSGRVPVGPIS